MKIIKWFVRFFILGIFISFFFSISRISGTGMEPTIKNGTNVILWKYFLGGPNPKRGDIVFYKKSSPNGLSSNEFVGRVVALPKESVKFYQGNFYFNNNAQQYRVDEEYLPPNTKTYVNTEDGNNLNWVSVGEYNYLVLPDKRDKKLSIEDYLVNRSDITGVICIKF